MAIYHLQANVIQRSKGRSAVAAAAYRAGVELLDERTGLTFDYSAKPGIGSTFIIGWPGSRQSLWNAAEMTEKRKDSTTAREYVVALPAELSAPDRQALAQALSMRINQRYGVAVDVCLHDVDNGNPHAHILTTTREVCPLTGEFGGKSIVDISNADRKKRGLPGTAKDELEQLKKDWCAMTNRALELRGFDARIDHRSLKKQGIFDRDPQIKHYGNPKLKAENELIKRRNTQRAQIQQELYELYHQQYHEELESERLIEAQIVRYEEYLESEQALQSESDVFCHEHQTTQELYANVQLLREHKEQYAREDSAEGQESRWSLLDQPGGSAPGW